jgi:hypothetical protein
MMARHPGDIRSRSARAYAAQIARHHRRYVAIFDRALAVALSVLGEAEIPRKSKQKVIAAALLGRLVESAQAGVELSRLGLERDAAAMVRISFEHFVMLRGCCADAEFVEEYLNADKLWQRKIMRAAMRQPDLPPEQRERFRTREHELASEIQSLGLCELRVAQVAGRFELAAEYDSLFRLASPFVHSSSHALEEYAQREGQVLVGLQFGPSERSTDVHVFTLTAHLLRGAGAVCNLVASTRYLGRWNRVYADLRQLQPSWPAP